MSLLNRRQAFEPSCTSGGTWYSCGFGSRFVGCCRSSNACENGCSAGNLEPATFDPDSYGDFPDQECSIGLWYTCTATNPPFLGCCKSNPCNIGSCPAGDLAAGFLSNDSAIAASFSPTGGASSTPTINPTSSPTSTSTTQPTSTHNVPAGAIAGGAVGGAIIAAGLIGFLIYLRKKTSKSNIVHHSPSPPEESLKSSATELFAGGSSKCKSSPSRSLK